LFGGIITSPCAKATLRYEAIALAILLFLLLLGSAGKQAGRLVKRLESTQKANDIQRRMLDAAARRPRDRYELVDRLRDGGF
jgi:hypothetical protein